MSDLASRAFRRILLIKPSSPGDIIHALPVLHGLRRRYPNAHLAWLVATPFADLIEADPALDEVIRFDRKRFGRLARSPAVAREFIAFVKELRRKRFDLVVDLQGLFRSGFLALASGAEVRIGFAAARELAWLFYTHKIPRSDPDDHAADKNYRVADMLGFADAPMDFAIATTDDDRRQAAQLLEASRLDAEQCYAVLVVATRWETKCWPPQRYGELAALLRQRHGIASLLVGGADDIERGRIAKQASAGAAENICGKTTLRGLAALIDGAAVVVTADSTPMHMAAALDRPLVALFGPTNPDRTGPYGRSHDVLSVNLECSPCYVRKLGQCAHDHACMRQITVESVADAAGQRLARADAAP